MMTFEVHELLEAIQDALKTQPARPSGALVSALVFHRDDQVTHAGTIRFEREVAVARPKREYPTATLAEAWMTVDDVLQFLTAAASGTAALAGVHLAGKLTNAPGQRKHRWATDDRVASPAFQWNLNWDEQGQAVDEQDPLVAPGLVPLPSIPYARRRWLCEGKRHQDAPHFGSWEMVLPDHRARVRSTSWSTDGLVLHLASDVPMDQIEVHTIWGGGEAAVPDGAPRAANPTMTLSPPDGVSEATVILVHDNAGVLATAYVQRDRCASAEREVLADVTDDILLGERDDVEFKPWTQQSNQKEREIVKTIIAFSNTMGGRLYIGVNDDTSVQSASELCQRFSAAPDEALAKAKARVQELVRERIGPTPTVEVEEVRYAAETVLRVTVDRGLMKPCAFIDGNDIYVRRGATNRRPTPQELVELQHQPSFTSI